AQDRAILHVGREADGLPVVTARHELAQDLDVVVLGVEEAVGRAAARASSPPSRSRQRPPLASSSAALVCSLSLDRGFQRTGRTTSIPRLETRCAKSSAKRWTDRKSTRLNSSH